MKHLYHEETTGNYGTQRKIVFDTSEIAPGEYETMALIEATGEELDSAVSHSPEDARRDFDAMIQRHAGPLQAALWGAGMVPGQRYTLVMLGDFGFPCSLRITFHSATLTSYAQYDDAVALDFTPIRRRKPRRLRLYDRSFLVYEGWRELPEDAAFDVEAGDGVVTRMSKYASFDERFLEDVKALWPDCIAAYDRKAQRREPEAAEPKPAEPEQAQAKRGPYPLLPGITVSFGVEGVEGPCIDMEIEEFARLFAPDGRPQEPAERLERALKRSAIASAAHLEDEDGGTCNFDAPALDFAACGMTKAQAEAVVRGAGLSCFDWRPFKSHRGEDGKLVKAPTYLVIGGFQRGQGQKRTSMAEAFCHNMNEDGFETMMYYQMD